MTALANERRWQKTVSVEFLQEIYRSMVALLLNLLKLSELQGAILRDQIETQLRYDARKQLYSPPAQASAYTSSPW